MYIAQLLNIICENSRLDLGFSIVARANTKPKPEYELLIDGFTHDGRGVARIDGKAVFVTGALVNAFVLSMWRETGILMKRKF